MKSTHFFVFFCLIFYKITAQCEVKNKIWPDQTMYFYMDPELFYYTESKSLKGNMTTDKNNYFLRILPKPFPLKEQNVKLDLPVHIKLANDSVYALDNFDVQYRSKDTSLSLMYMIPNKYLSLFEQLNVKNLELDLGDDSGHRTYIFVLHQATLKEQLQCLKEVK